MTVRSDDIPTSIHSTTDDGEWEKGKKGIKPQEELDEEDASASFRLLDLGDVPVELLAKGLRRQQRSRGVDSTHEGIQKTAIHVAAPSLCSTPREAGG